MKRFTRDDTEHGQEYYLASEVDKALAAQPAQEPVAWGIIASNTGRICQVKLDASEVEGHNPQHIAPLYTTPQPAQEPVNQTLFGYEIFGCFFRNFDDALNAFKNQGLTWATPDGPFNGMNEDWIKKNIREVYLHGTSELERLNNIGNGGPINTQTD